ncbi:MAG: SRPBCC domain-containing protein [Mesorhizobium sp.]|nr:SRPBCC domain-containing protein [Mesorhizobium sp.]MBL8578046.1 SRPBCC domain-containing protein [Mesorhizobium sp.]
MTDANFTTGFTVDRTPQEVFAAINNVRGWWSEDIRGRTEKVGDIFNYRFRDIHRCTVKIKTSVPGKKVVWSILDNYFNFTEDKSEWKGTQVVFDIVPAKDGTELKVTHVGLVPDYECFDVCTAGWTTYVNGSLRDLILTGKGQPNIGEPRNETERALAEEAL